MKTRQRPLAPKRQRGGQPHNSNAMKHGFRAGEPQANTAHPGRRPSPEGGVGPLDNQDHPPGRRRGGQPHNSNAMKHGFYSSLFKARERRLLDQIQPADLSAEIELIRVTSARFLEALDRSKEPGDYEASLTALRAVNLSAQSIAMLLRIQALTGSLKRELADLRKSLEEDRGDEDDRSASTPDSWGLVPSA